MADSTGMSPQYAADGNRSSGKNWWVALLLSAFILPGMGQLYLGKKVTGIAIILVVNLLMLLGVVLILKGLSPVIAAKIASGVVDTGEVLSGLDGISGYGKGLLAGFIVVWCFSVGELLRDKR